MARLMNARPFLGLLCASSWLFAASSLAFSSPEADTSAITIMSERAANSTSLESACQAALAALGEAQVDLRPLNQTVVEENW